MNKLSAQLWFERAIRQHADEHGPSGGGWNISMILERLHRAHETGASGAEAETIVSGEAHASMLKAAKAAAAERMRERAALVVENDDTMDQRGIVAAIRALPTDGE